MLLVFVQFFVLFLSVGKTNGKPGHHHVPVDNRTLEEIYEAALAEGARLIIYANGNRAFLGRTLNGTIPAFQRQFPGINLDIVVDQTNPLASRVNIQLANHSLVADLVQLESIHDFYRWKAEGKLLYYKPNAWENIYWRFKDKDGAFTSISGTVFAFVVNTDLLPNEADWPRGYGDLVENAKYRDSIIAGYPVDIFSPDTTLYGHKLARDKCGIKWLEGLRAQNVTFMRDTSLIPTALSSGKYSVGLFRVIPGSATPNLRFVLPQEDKFVSYTVLTAIFKETKHKEAAKLYMNWMLEKGMQSTLPWTIRMDVDPPTGYKHIWEYGQQSEYADFVNFYLDRAAAEKSRNELYLIVGESEGPRPMDPDNLLGINPPY